MNRKTGYIYRWRNLVNYKCYYGSSTNILRRYNGHVKDLEKNKNTIHLQAAWNKYGASNFKFEIVEENIDSRETLQREQWWLDFTKCYLPKYGYNIAHYSTAPMRDRHQTEAFKEKMKGKKVWNKGLTKETDSRVAVASINMRGKKLKAMTEQGKQIRHESGKKAWVERHKIWFKNNSEAMQCLMRELQNKTIMSRKEVVEILKCNNARHDLCFVYSAFKYLQENNFLQILKRAKIRIVQEVNYAVA